MNELLIVTGSSSGLGAALVELGLDHGQRVIGIARRNVQLDHPNYIHLQADLSEIDSLGRLSEPLNSYLDASQGYDRVVLINNAAQLGPVGLLANLDLNELQQAHRLNVLAPLSLTQLLLNQTVDTPLCIANISSGAATSPYQGWGSYCSTKAALRMLSQTAALEYANRDLRVLLYAPGVIDTPMQEEVRNSDPQAFPNVSKFKALHASNQLADPKDAARELLQLVQRQDLPAFYESRFSG